MSGFTFVHAADLHLDAPFRGVREILREDAGQEAQALESLMPKAGFTALDRLVEVCRRVRAHCLILAGDVYNTAEGSLKAGLALRDACLRLQEDDIVVFLAHGNHDPLRRNDAVPLPANVVVFGAEPEVHTLQAGGQTVHIAGVSHAREKEDRNLAALFPALPSGDFRIGVLHCALSGRSGPHEVYAPCSVDDLLAPGYDYWALGHVHTRQEIRPAGAFGPCIVYPGSLQGLHVRETGEHGCTVVRVGAAAGSTFGGGVGMGAPAGSAFGAATGMAAGATSGTASSGPASVASDLAPGIAPTGASGTISGMASGVGSSMLCATEFVPLAPIRWEAPVIALEEAGVTLPDLEAHILEQLEALRGTSGSPSAASVAVSFSATSRPAESPLGESPFAPALISARLTLTGRTPLHGELARPHAAAELRARLNAALEGSGLWLRDLIQDSRAPLDMEALGLREDLVGAAVRRRQAALTDPEARDAARKALGELFAGRRFAAYIPPPDDAELDDLIRQAGDLCLDLLEGR